MNDSDIKVNINEIPKHDLDRLCRATLEACRRFYSDPKNVERYEKWKAERDAKRGETVCQEQ